MRNLSTDKNTAQSKALKLGYSVDKPEFTLDEINRRNSEQVTATREAVERNARVLQQEKDQFKIDLVNEGRVPFGKFQGQKIEDMEYGYLRWVVLQTNSDDVAMLVLGAWIQTNLDEFMELFNAENYKGNRKYFG